MNDSDFEKVNNVFLSTGWGNYKSEITTFSYGTKNFKLVYLQHLSRFKIFNRKEGQDAIDKLINYITEK